MPRSVHVMGWFSFGPALFSVLCAGLACDATDETLGAVERPVQEVAGVRTDEVKPVRVVATVNDQVISEEELTRRVDRIAQLYRHSRRPLTPKVLAEKRTEVLHRLVDRELLRDYLEDRSAGIDAEVLDAELEGQIQQRFGSEEAFRRFLQTEELRMAEYREELRLELALQAYLQADLSAEPLSQDELRVHYERIANRRPAGERVRASVLSLRVPPGADSATRERIRQSLQHTIEEISSGDEFLATANEISQGVTTERMERIRWVERHHVHPLAAQALFGGELERGPTALIQTPSGFEVYWVHERRPAGVRGFDEVEALLQQRARQAAMADRRRALVEELRRQASITIEE